jgi:hypothetical protein
MEENQLERIILYKYERNGVVYCTPNEMIASMRNESGLYYAVEHLK